MKKLLVLAVIAASFTMTSCKKDWTCSCSQGGTTTEYKFTKVVKKDAKKACDTWDTQFKVAGGSCSLK